MAGVWVAGSAFFGYVAIQNMLGVDAVLAEPSAEAAKVVQKLGGPTARMFLRYQAAEMTRQFLYRWEVIQFVIAALLAAILFLGTHVNRLVIAFCGIIASIVGLMHFVITPELIYLGRQADFKPDPGRQLHALYALYAGLDLIKVVLILILAVYLFVMKSRGRRTSSRRSTGDVLETANRA